MNGVQIPNKKEFTLPFHGRDLKFTVSDLAGQANASVIGQYGDTTVLVTVVMGSQDRAIDFFPLTVDYEERFYAAGKIIGSRFVRREGRPSQEAVLSGRLIDRSIRPLFDSRLRRDVQVVVTILSYDEQNDPDFLALMTTSVALSISNIPWKGPIAGVRMLLDEQIKINPLVKELEEVLQKEHTCDAFFSGTAHDTINMIELGGREISEQDAENLFARAQAEIATLIQFEKEIIAKVGKPKAEVALAAYDPQVAAVIRAFAWDKLQEIVCLADRVQRSAAMEELRAQIDAHLAEKEMAEAKLVGAIWEDLVNEVVHLNILEKDKRPDGRKIEEIRPLFSGAGVLARVHGSGLFMRGETQSLAVTTLAAPGSEQLVETMEQTGKRRFMLHYNFPPYSTGEVGRVGSPGRREIGHGALAEKALRAVIPTKDDFPYTVRVVSEILSSNGSSSMASVCAGTLSLMDAGVPIKKPVAGIAMGLMTHQGYNPESTRAEFKVLTDLQGFEDHYGDMDFKVAGTAEGITAIQMDLKIEGITPAIYKQGLVQAHAARMIILEKIREILPAPRPEISPYAPKIAIVNIKPAQIGMVIGPGGKMINGLIEKFKLETIDIDDDGSVFVAGADLVNVQAAVDAIKGMTKEYEVGETVTGPIVRVLDFGAIVDLGGGRDGMIHVSELKHGFVDKVTDVVKEGEVVTAKVIKVEEGKIGLSIKALLPRPEGQPAPRPRPHTGHAS